MADDPSILSSFYAGQRLFLTGASGFVGKVLLARLLHHVQCDKIFILLRAPAGGSAHDRLVKQILNSPVFDAARKVHGDDWIPWACSRVEAVPGDLLAPNLGLSKEQTENLQKQVTVVMHVAASVHFNSPLVDNYKSNVEGSLRMLEFAQKCPNMQVFVHTSTCYVNSDNPGVVPEDIVPLPWRCTDLLTAIKRVMDVSNQPDSAGTALAMEKQLLGKFPNTYAFTKRLCESIMAREWELRNIRAKEPAGSCQDYDPKNLVSLLNSECGEFAFPLCILRPSIIGCSYKYPQGGWIDNLNATGGMLLLSSLGILQALPANPNIIGDQVPVDAVVDALIVSGAAVAASNYIHTKSDFQSSHPAFQSTKTAAKIIASKSQLIDPVPVPKLVHQKSVSLSNTSDVLAKPHNYSNSEQKFGSNSINQWKDSAGVYVVHACTSDLNPTKWADALVYGREYNMLYPYYNRINRELRSPYFHREFEAFKRHFMIEQKAPAMIVSTVASHLLPASSATTRASSLLYSGLLKAEKAAEAFKPFCYEEWIFRQPNIAKLTQLLNRNESEILFLDVRSLDWRKYYHLFYYGIARFLLNEASGAEPPQGDCLYVDILRKHVLEFSIDCPPITTRMIPNSVEFIRSSPPQSWAPEEALVKTATLSNPQVQAATDKKARYFVKIGKRKPGTRIRMTREEIDQLVAQDARSLYTSLAGTIKPVCVYILAGVLHKSFVKLLDRIIVDDSQLKKLKSLADSVNGGTPILLLPTHRSYLDFLVVSCVCYAYGLPLPFIAADQAFATIALAHKFLRNAGAFFVKRNLRSTKGSPEEVLNNELFVQILKAYVQVVAEKYGCLEIFLEGGRSKTGLLLKPKVGMLSWITELYFNGTVKDILAVPITLSYDRILESNTFPQELLGEKKTQEGLLRVLNVVRHMSSNDNNLPQLAPAAGSRGLPPRCGPGYRPFGAIAMRFMDAISFKEHIAATFPQHQFSVSASNSASASISNPISMRKEITFSFAMAVMNALSSGLYVTPTTLVATITLMHHNGVREEDLVEQVAWLRDQILMRNGEIAPGCGGFMYDPSVCVQVVLKKYLKDAVDQKRGGWEVSALHTPQTSNSTLSQLGSVAGTPWQAVAPTRAYLPRLLLSFYRNMCFHLFANEAFVAVSLQSFGYTQAWDSGVSFADLEKAVAFLLTLMQDHFVYHAKMNKDSIGNVIQLMVSRGILREVSSSKDNESRIAFVPSSELIVSLLSHFLWPFVDSYWAFGNGLFTLQANGDSQRSSTATEQQLVSRAHWLAHGLHKENVVAFFESSAYPTMAGAVVGYCNAGILKKCLNDLDGSAFELTPEFLKEEALQELLNSIARYRQSSANILSHPDPSIRSLNRKQMLTALPMFARL